MNDKPVPEPKEKTKKRKRNASLAGKRPPVSKGPFVRENPTRPLRSFCLNNPSTLCVCARYSNRARLVNVTDSPRNVMCIYRGP